MGHELSYVGDAGAGCRIYRETSGRYVVSQGDRLQEGRRVATLPCAYATCQELGAVVASSLAGGADPSGDLR
ncbi:MAG: hypothetical protein VKM34_07360 [Cyanobacteriota bacterium]|nr:hypothetical protein [Cyanobacteriota bacterium]